MRDVKVLESFKRKIEKELKEKNVFKHWRKEVDINGNGTRGYLIKEGINKGKYIKWNQLELERTVVLL